MSKWGDFFKAYGKKMGRVAGAMATVGLSEIPVAMANKGKDARNQKADAFGRIENRQAPTLQMDSQGIGTNKIHQGANELKAGVGSAQQARFTSPGQYTSAGKSADFANDLYKALNVQRPMDTRDTMREAAQAQINASGQQAARADAANLQRMGAGRSGAALALASNRNANLGAARTNAELQIQQDFANRQTGFDQQLLAAAQNYGQNASQYNLARAQAANQMAQFNAGQRSDNQALDLQRRTQLANAQMEAGSQLNNDQYQRQMSQFEASLLPYQMQNALDMAKIADAQQTQANLWNFGGQLGGAIIGGASRIGAAKVG